jgi:DNA-binding GntR family transcriptional regulator
LIENDLAVRFGTSRGPVREAIRELARQGLVAELPRRGTVVSTLNARDLAEVYSIREGLELAASRVVVERASDAELEGLAEPLQAMEAVNRSRTNYIFKVYDHDLAFHRRLVALAGNNRMAEINEVMLAQTALLLRAAIESNQTLRTYLDRPVHRGLLDALQERDIGRAQEAVAAHYRYAEERLFAQFADD